MGSFGFRFRNRMAELHRDESGQAMTEYILILAFAAIAASTLARKLLGFFDGGILRIGAQLEKDLKSGRSQLNTWTN